MIVLGREGASRLSKRCHPNSHSMLHLGLSVRSFSMEPAETAGRTLRVSRRKALAVTPQPSHAEQVTAKFASVFAGHLSKSPKDMPVAEFSNLEIGGPAERDRPGMTEGFPERLRSLDRVGRIWASDRLTRDDVGADVVERHDHELDDLGHKSRFLHHTLVSHWPHGDGRGVLLFFRLLQARPLLLRQIKYENELSRVPLNENAHRADDRQDLRRMEPGQELAP